MCDDIERAQVVDLPRRQVRADAGGDADQQRPQAAPARGNRVVVVLELGEKYFGGLSCATARKRGNTLASSSA